MSKETNTKTNIVYRYKGNLYINLTNQCTARCLYCIKNSWKGLFRSHDLHLSSEPTADDVISAVSDYQNDHFTEVIFCGYGEPFVRFDVLKKVAEFLKSKGFLVRINTSGHGNLIHGRNIVPDLKGLIDAISISLNAETPEKYELIHKPRFGIKTFEGILSFVKECTKIIPHVTITTIDLPDNWSPGMPGIDVEACRRIAERLHAAFRVRPYLSTYEDS